MNPHPTPPPRLHAKPTDPSADVSYPTPKRGPAKSAAEIIFRLDDPKVAEHCARMVFKYNLNYEAAVAVMSPRKLTEAQIASEARRMERHPKVKAALQRLYAEVGLDNAGFNKLKAVCWEWTLGSNPKLQVAGAKLLGAMYGIAAKADDEKQIKPLPIAGAEELMKSIMGESNKNPTGFEDGAEDE